MNDSNVWSVMASSRKLISADLLSVVTDRLRAVATPDARLLLGLSGGLDSVVLLDILVQLAPGLRFTLSALHINHGISKNAGQWAVFCEALCRERGVAFAVEVVDLSPYRTLGVEGAARQARYEALTRHAASADRVVIAQHQDDQIETLLLQLMRGAGARGLAGMPVQRSMVGTNAQLIRPLLDVARTDIEGYARLHGLKWIEDESNSDIRYKRNFLRHQIIPEFSAGFPGYRVAVARSIANLAEASALLDIMADEDLAHVVVGQGVNVLEITKLGEARARNALRRWCERCGLPWPGLARLKELWRQILQPGKDAQIAIPIAGWSFRLYRGILYLQPCTSVPDGFVCRFWGGEAEVEFSELGGTLRFQGGTGNGVSAARIKADGLTLRSRRGGEKLQPDCKRPRRTLKNLFQENGVPPWLRERLPLIYCGKDLISVPGVGVDCKWQAGLGEASLVITWAMHGEPGIEDSAPV